MSTTSSSVVPKRPPSLPLTVRLSMSLLSNTTNLAKRADGTVNRRLLSLIDPPTPPSTRSRVRSFDIVVDPARNLWLRLFLPWPTPSSLPLVVYFHGGGFVFLSPATKAYNSLCRRLARDIPAAIASVAYRLAPEHKCPAAYLDGLDCLRFLDSYNTDLDIDFSRCFLIGDSAGGNVAHNVARKWASDKTYNYTRMSIVGVVAIQPYFGGMELTEAELRLKKAPLVTAKRTEWLWKAFLPEGSGRDHEGRSAFGKDGEGELEMGYPEKAMVVVGGWDPLKEWQRRFGEGLGRRGRMVRVVEYERMVHGFYVFPKVKETRLVMEEIKGFVNDTITKRC